MPKAHVQLTTYTLDGIPLKYRLIRSGRRVKTVTLQFNADDPDPDRRLWLSVPHGMSDRQISDFLQSREDWLRKCRKALDNAPSRKDWDKGELIPFRGTNILAIVDPHAELGKLDGLLVQRSMVSNELRFGVPDGVNGYERDRQIQDEIERWYKNEARQYLPGRVAHWSDLTGLVPERVRIGSAKTRWGSCSFRKSINLSWRLIKLPDPLSDYVIVHELAHLQEMNHQKGFWDLVESILPDAKERRKRLRAQSGRREE